MNSPLARFYTAYRTATDERKGYLARGMNILSGMKMADVDLDKAKDYAARNLVTEMLQGTPGIHIMERPYPTQESIPNLTPEQVALLRMQASIEKRVRERKKVEEKMGLHH